MKKSGFVFVETVIVIVILTVGMIIIYSSFSSVLNSSKRRITYDDVAYIYRTYYIQDFISSLNMEEYVKRNINDDNKIVKFNCENNDYLFKIDGNNPSEGLPVSEEVKKSFCANLNSYFDISAIYITKYNVSDLKRCTTASGSISSNCSSSIKSSLNDLSVGTIYYLRTLTGTDEDLDSYRLIIVYNDRQIEVDNNVTRIKVNNEYKCPDGYDEANNTCYKIIRKNYFSNVKMTSKSKL